VTWNRRRSAATALAAGVVAALAVLTLRTAPPRDRPPTATPAPLTRPSQPAGTSTVMPLRLMPLGDSITYGRGSSDNGGYRIDLGRRLAEAGFPVTFVGSQHAGPPGVDDANEGHTGWTIGRLTGHVTGWLNAARPDVILLHAGTNDMDSDDEARRAPSRLGRLLDRIARTCPRAQVFVAQIVGSGRPDRQRRIDRYNAALARMVTRRGQHVHLVDQRGVTAVLLRDGLHPDDVGYARMAAVWAAAIEEVLGAGEF
jgi:lysophospholipase L1-like esterase